MSGVEKTKSPFGPELAPRPNGMRSRGAKQSSQSPEQEFRDCELKYRLLVETLPHAITVIESGKIVFANQTAAEVLGFKKAEHLVGKDPFEFVAKSEEARVRDYFQRRMSGEPGVPEQYETVGIRRNGTEFPVEVRVRTFSLGGQRSFQLVVTDLTGRRQSETRLRLFAGAMEQMAEGVALVDLEGRLLFPNGFLAAMHGYATHELVGRHIAILYPSEELLNLAAAREETLRAGAFKGEFLHRRKNGSLFPVFITSSLTRNDNGHPVGMIVTVRDPSETICAEKITNSWHEKSSQQVRDLETRLRETGEQLNESQSKLMDYMTRWEQAREALRIVIGQSESRNRDLEQEIFHTFTKRILPTVYQLKSERLPDSSLLLLNSLEFQLKSLFSPPQRVLDQREVLLSPRETRLCELIRSGLTSKQIAEATGISLATVFVHRSHIRKKLGLVGSGDNLVTYLGKGRAARFTHDV